MTEDGEDKYGESDADELDDTAIWSSLIGNIVAVIMATFFYFQSKDCKETCPQKNKTPKKYNPESFANALNDLKKMAETLKRQECSCSDKSKKVKKKENPPVTPATSDTSKKSAKERKVPKERSPINVLAARAPLCDRDADNILEAHKPQNSNLSILCDQGTTTCNDDYTGYVQCGACGAMDGATDADCEECCHRKCETCCQTVEDDEDDYQPYEDPESGPSETYEESDDCSPCKPCNPCGQEKLKCITSNVCGESIHDSIHDVEEACMVTGQEEHRTESSPPPPEDEEACTYGCEELVEDKHIQLPEKKFNYCPRKQKPKAHQQYKQEVPKKYGDEDDDNDDEFFDETPRKPNVPCTGHTCGKKYQPQYQTQNSNQNTKKQITPKSSQHTSRSAAPSKMEPCPRSQAYSTPPPKKMVNTASGSDNPHKTPAKARTPPIADPTCPGSKNRFVDKEPIQPVESKQFPRTPSPSRNTVCPPTCPTTQNPRILENSSPIRSQYGYADRSYPAQQPRCIRQIVKTTTRIPAQYDDEEAPMRRTIIRKTSKQLMYDNNEYMALEEEGNFTVYAAPSNTSRNKIGQGRPVLQAYNKPVERRPYAREEARPMASTSKLTCPSTCPTAKRSKSSFQYMPPGAIAISSSRNTLGVEKAKQNLGKYGVSEQEENYLKQKQKRMG